ncbi:MAG TPA: UDP-3-O-(3-hydroxymyristoyl)glucosamine N-acyltransferase [Gammaproteobacteria bacterium]|nr:UDP-3-O-(3-hydroxymyristoyl)glucosamine N-acyltransferase [Gammaproteobacteria bacterium]
MSIAQKAQQQKTLGALASLTEAKLIGSPERIIQGVGTLLAAQKGEITFLAEPKYRDQLLKTKADAVILKEIHAKDCPVFALVVEDPKLAFAKVLQALFPLPVSTATAHPSAVIGQGCEIDPTCQIGPNCVIGDRVKIGKQVILHANCVVGEDCEIGANTIIYPNTTLYSDVHIGKHCIIQSGAVIGGDGFGFANDRGKWVKVPQLGGVRIGDGVEIGANTTIDRGAIEDTRIGNNVILDNLIQIAHNVEMGEGTAMAAGSAIAGSTKIGKYCLIGGACGIAGHINLADGVTLVAGSMVGQSLEKGTYGSGLPVRPVMQWKRNMMRLNKLDELATRLAKLEKEVHIQEKES